MGIASLFIEMNNSLNDLCKSEKSELRFRRLVSRTVNAVQADVQALRDNIEKEYKNDLLAKTELCEASDGNRK
jgi:hypothetical protein